MHFKLKSDQGKVSGCARNFLFNLFLGIKNGNNGWSGSCENLKRMVFIAITLVGFYSNIPELMAQKPELPDINASVSGAITCVNTSVELKGDSKTPGVFYTWTGPRGYFSNAQNSITAIMGDYTLTVTNPIDNTSATAHVKVLYDTASPDIKATVSGVLTCKDTIVTLTGISSVTDANFTWKGPENFASSQKITVINTPGVYKLTVTNQKNGCSTNKQVHVNQNITPPSGVLATASGVLNCKVSTVELNGISTTKHVLYSWIGPGFASIEKNLVIADQGTYILTVTDSSNGCSSKDSVMVVKDVSQPKQVKALVSDTLTCKMSKVLLSVSSATPNANFNWSGPGNFASTESTFETSVAGSYMVSVINPENGCSAKEIVFVVKDTTGPDNIAVIVPDILTCKVKSVTLKVLTSSTVAYSWKGSAGFTSNLAEPSINKADKYEVLVTKLSNGCSVTKSILVEQNIMYPGGVEATVADSLSCNTPLVQMNAKSTLLKANYNWSGPNNYKSTEKNPMVKLPGNYILTATNPENGCTSNSNVTVKGIACVDKH
jgi:hypothetical protein